MIKSNFIDFHAHIIPGADHGTSKNETTEKQLRILSSAGIGRVVATPHFYPHKVLLEDFISKRESCIENMKQIISEDSPIIYPAAEVLLTPGLNKLKGIESLCIKGTRCMLVELPALEFDKDLDNTLHEIMSMDITPVIAHVERYNKKTVEYLLDINVPCQINAESLVSWKKKRSVLKYFYQGNIVAIGTDIHGPGEHFASDYIKAREILADKFDLLTVKSQRLLDGAESIN